MYLSQIPPLDTWHAPVHNSCFVLTSCQYVFYIAVCALCSLHPSLHPSCDCFIPLVVPTNSVYFVNNLSIYTFQCLSFIVKTCCMPAVLSLCFPQFLLSLFSGYFLVLTLTLFASLVCCCLRWFWSLPWTLTMIYRLLLINSMLILDLKGGDLPSPNFTVATKFYWCKSDVLTIWVTACRTE